MRDKNNFLIHFLFLFSILYFVHCDYSITIKLGKNGTNAILSPDFSNMPDKIFINDKETNVTKKVKISNNLVDIVKLKWNNKINSCANMFRDCKNITRINLTDFDTSNAASMAYMFSGCSSLSSLILTSIITSQVTNMEYMFYFCIKLNSIDI